jgi:hypothetical protein
MSKGVCVRNYDDNEVSELLNKQSLILMIVVLNSSPSTFLQSVYIASMRIRYLRREQSVETDLPYFLTGVSTVCTNALIRSFFASFPRDVSDIVMLNQQLHPASADDELHRHGI